MNVVEELRNLDVNDVGRWPLAFRAAVIAIVFVGVVGLGIYFTIIKDKRPLLQRAQNDEQTLRITFENKQRKAQPSARVAGRLTNIRNLGLIAGLSIVRDAEDGEPYDAGDGVGGRVARHMREEGSVITRFVGDKLVFAPPLIVQPAEIDQIVEATKNAVAEVTGM